MSLSYNTDREATRIRSEFKKSLLNATENIRQLSCAIVTDVRDSSRAFHSVKLVELSDEDTKELIEAHDTLLNICGVYEDLVKKISK